MFLYILQDLEMNTKVIKCGVTTFSTGIIVIVEKFYIMRISTQQQGVESSTSLVGPSDA